MFIDITIKITLDQAANAQSHQRKNLFGHQGTHFDVMNKEFPLAYTCRKGIVFDVSTVVDREICCSDIDLNAVKQGMFVAFYSGWIESMEYGSKAYFTDHPQLSVELIDALLDRGVSIIGIDFAGVRRNAEHTPMDQHCADRGAFVIENLCNLKAVINTGGTFTAHTYPMNFAGLTGLPCRVIAEV